MRISDWSSDVCSSDLFRRAPRKAQHDKCFVRSAVDADPANMLEIGARPAEFEPARARDAIDHDLCCTLVEDEIGVGDERVDAKDFGVDARRSEEHTSELQSLLRTSYAVFCLKKKT